MKLKSPAVMIPLALWSEPVSCVAARLEPEPDRVRPTCTIVVEFRTRRGEIDVRTLDRVLEYVKAAPAINKAYEETSGTEKRAALCLVIEDTQMALTTFEQLISIVPPQGVRLPRLRLKPPPVVLRYQGK